MSITPVRNDSLWGADSRQVFAVVIFTAAMSLGFFLVEDQVSRGQLWFEEVDKLHPTMLALLVVSMALSVAQMGYTPWPRLQSRATALLPGFAIVIGLTALVRGIQTIFAVDLPILDAVLGSLGPQAHVKFAALALLFIVCASSVPLKPTVVASLLKQFSLFVVGAICVAQIGEFSRQTEHFTPWMWMGTSMFLVLLVLIRATAVDVWTSMFDRRSPASNIVLGVGMLLTLLGTFVLSWWVSKWISIAQAIGTWVGLVAWVNWYRPREIKHRRHQGRPGFAGDVMDGHLQPQPALLAKPLPAHDPFLGWVAYWHFAAPMWQRHALEALMFFGLALVGVLIASAAESNVARIWWANAYLAYCLIRRSPNQWVSTIFIFYAALFAANLVVGNTWSGSAILSATNAFEGFILAFAVTGTLQLRIVQGRVLLSPKQLSMLMPATFVLALCVLLMAPVGGAMLFLLFGGDLAGHMFDWALGSALGLMTIMPFGLGVLMEAHTGYENLRPNRPSYPWLRLSYLACVLALPWLELPIVRSYPLLAFVLLCLPLFALPSLSQAARLFAIAAPVYLLICANVSNETEWLRLAIFILMASVTLTTVFINRVSLHQSKIELDTALRLTPTAVLTLDASGRVRSASENAIQWLESDQRQIQGQLLTSFFDEGEEIQRQSVATFDSNPRGIFEMLVHHTRQSGERLAFMARFQGVHDPSSLSRYLVALKDVSDELRAKQQRDEQIDKAPGIVLIQGKDLKIRRCSQGWVDFSGYTSEETVGKDLFEFLAPIAPSTTKAYSSAIPVDTTRGGKSDQEFGLRRKSGELCSVIMKPIPYDNADNDYYFRTNLIDITALRQTVNTVQGYLDASLAAYAFVTEDSRLIYASEAYVQLRGGPQALELSPEGFYEPESYREYLRIMEITKDMPLNTPYVHPIPLKVKRLDGSVISIRRSQRWFKNPTGEGRLLLVMFEDISNLLATQEALEQLANRDHLTGLLSRRGMKDRLSGMVTPSDLALFVIDLDYFKSVNDNHGHDAGDSLLKAVANTLDAAVRNMGWAIRLGGEEFCLIITWTSFDDIDQFANTLLAAINDTSIDVHNKIIHRSASIGVTKFEAGEDLSRALHMADLAQREAKLNGRNRVVWADEQLVAALTERGQFLSAEEVQQALLANEIYYAVQPIWNVSDSTIEGFEALIRWQKADGTRLSPKVFLPVLQTVFQDPDYNKLKDNLVSHVFQNLTFFPDAYVSFNITLEEMSYVGAADEMRERIERLIDHRKRKVAFEISESAIHTRTDEDVVRKEIRKLHDWGYLIALDDFGIESSNLKRLQDFPIDILKLDKVLIDDVVKNMEQRKTVFSLARMVKVLGIKLVVEGVEDPYQVQVLSLMGLHLQQGFVHAHPMRPEEVRAALPDIGCGLMIKNTLQMKVGNTLREEFGDGGPLR